jgi:hypothetical protein
MKERESVKGEYDGESLMVEGILLRRGSSFYGEFYFGGSLGFAERGV